MSIILTNGSTGLFDRLGTLAKLLYDVNAYQGTTVPTDIDAIIAQYGSADQTLIDSINTQMIGGQGAAGGMAALAQSMSRSVLLQMVYEDTGFYKTSLNLAMQELIRQMRASTDTVLGYTCSGTVTSTNVTNGNGSLVVSVKDSRGYNQDNLLVETMRVAVTGDATTNSNLAGNEQFLATGQVAETNPLAQDWPLGSGCSTSLSAIDATQNNAAGNLLTNSDFETFTVANTPDNWVIATGAAGTNVVSAASPVYTGAKCVGFVGGATLTAIQQTFASTAGTNGSLVAQTPYSFCVKLRVNSVPAAGVLQVALVDGSGTVLTDVSGGSCAATVACSTLSSSAWTTFSGTLRTPYIMPTTAKLRVKLTTALSSGSTLYIDHLGFGRATYAYAGGPTLAVFSGSSQFYIADWFSVALANNRPSNLKSFQLYFDRVFGMRSLGLMLPSATAGNTISDALIA